MDCIVTYATACSALEWHSRLKPIPICIPERRISKPIQAVTITFVGTVVFLGIVLFLHPGGSGHRSAVVQTDEERDARESGTATTSAGTAEATESSPISVKMTATNTEGGSATSTYGTATTLSTRTAAAATVTKKRLQKGPAVPLACVTGPGTVRSGLPPDGICNFVIFAHARFAGDVLLPTSNEKAFGNFLLAAARSKSSKFLVSFRDEDMDSTNQFMTGSKAVPTVEHYRTKGIRGYGFAYIERSLDVIEEESRILGNSLLIMKNITHTEDNTLPITFVGLMIRTRRGQARTNVLSFSLALLRVVNLYIMISHTPVVSSIRCHVEPISAWSSSSFNDPSLLSVEDAADVIKGEELYNVTFFLTMSLGVLQFRLPVDGWNETQSLKGLNCYTSRMVSYDKVCSKPMQRGSASDDAYIAYDYDISSGAWRSYETEYTIKKKMELAGKRVSLTRRRGVAWAVYDTNLEDSMGICRVPDRESPSSAWRRLLFIRSLMDKYL